MSATRVVAHAPAEYIPKADQLIGERLHIFEDLSLQRCVKRLSERIIRAGSHRAHRLGNAQAPACLPVPFPTALAGIRGVYLTGIRPPPLVWCLVPVVSRWPRPWVLKSVNWIVGVGWRQDWLKRRIPRRWRFKGHLSLKPRWQGISCRRVDYITQRDRETFILPHLQGGLTSLPI